MLYMNIVGQTETVLPSGERVCVCVSVCETTKSTRAEKFDRQMDGQVDNIYCHVA